MSSVFGTFVQYSLAPPNFARQKIPKGFPSGFLFFVLSVNLNRAVGLNRYLHSVLDVIKKFFTDSR